MNCNLERLAIRIKGVVQGVGFRPFIFKLATEFGLTGWVTNDSAGVLVEVEGSSSALNAFLQAIPVRVPPLARIDSLEYREVELVRDVEFRIKETDRSERVQTLIAPDLAICPDCLKEMLDPKDRRYQYPFINCTNCGPRFTIIEEMPYDRPFTTMREFAMCPTCQQEYDDPRNRRFHAQPNACPDCGPKVWLTSADGQLLGCTEPVAELRRYLADGKIAGVKGLGGYHLVCDALNHGAVEMLRRRKHRPDKPLAVMLPTLALVKKYCEVSGEEERLLLSPARPIVLLQWKTKGADGIATGVAPGQSRLGVMLPYTPLHYQLFDDGLEVLVMTSGNLSGEPIIYDDAEAVARLGQIVDCFLMHNRQIVRPCDDSVQRVDGEPAMLRRSRGYAPMPLRFAALQGKGLPSVLGSGGELKNTFGLYRDGQVFLSQHIGDLKTRNGFHHYRQMVEEMIRLLEIEPEIIAYDLHPGYLSTRHVLERYRGKQLIGVQHHHAHIASCMAEHGLTGEVIGFAFDGTGYGTDGKIWGGECLVVAPDRFRRWAHLRYLPLPGGDQATQEPWRLGAAYLELALAGERWVRELPLWKNVPGERWALLQQTLQQGLNTLETSSMGRLFDAVATILGLMGTVSYEGQAAIALEELSEGAVGSPYPFVLTGEEPYVLDPLVTVVAIADELRRGVTGREIARRFHGTVVEMAYEVARRIREELGLNRVVLSGGVFQNRLLSLALQQRLTDAGFTVYQQRQVPANDGGLVLGQIYVAAARTWEGEGVGLHK